MFSVGIVILNMLYALQNKGEALAIVKSKQEYEAKRSYIGQLHECNIVKNSENPKELSQMLRGVFTWDQSQRSSLQDIASNRWLNDKPILTVKYL